MARKFTGANKYAQALKQTKGKSCNRKAVLKAVKAGSSPSQAVARHCGGRSRSK